ncbi:MAG: hypothetical protein WBI14_02905 [Anaerolineaceae bacterium]
MNIIDKLRAITEIQKPLSSGFHAYHTPHGATPQYRLHLRVEPDGEGVLIVNASSVLHLNRTATEIVYNLIQGKTDVENANLINKRFKVDPQTSLNDVALLHQQLDKLLNTVDLDPEAQNLFEPHLTVENISAPYRLDCYLNDDIEDRQPALSLEDWKSIIQKAFNAGIPHVLFCGTEPTEVEWLPDLVAYTEELGLVTGLISSGSKLASSGFLEKLINDGLDHLMIVFDPLDETIREGLKTVLPMDLYTTVGLVVRTEVDYAEIITWLDNLGANAFSLIAYDQSDVVPLQMLADQLVLSNHRLVNDLPFPIDFRQSRGQASDLLPEARYINLTVSTNGDVFADNTWDESLGNLLHDDFDIIWSNRRPQA